jgi:hypothetical protein
MDFELAPTWMGGIMQGLHPNENGLLPPLRISGFQLHCKGFRQFFIWQFCDDCTPKKKHELSQKNSAPKKKHELSQKNTTNSSSFKFNHDAL